MKRGFLRKSFRRAKSFVRKTVISMQPLEAKRISLQDFTISAKTTTAFDNPVTVELLICQETMDEEVEGNGTVGAQIPLYSKLVSLKTNLTLHSLTAGQTYRWLLVKNPDGDLSAANFMTHWHTSDDNSTAREVREHIISKGYLVAGDRTTPPLRIPYRRSTLKRLGSFREGDKLQLIIAQSGTVAASVTGFGTAYVRTN